MGSQGSPIVANLYMEMFERKAITSAIVSPRLGLRYVDDTFAIWPHSVDQLEEFHLHLNRQHPFTREMEADNHISFLNVSVKRNAAPQCIENPHTLTYTLITPHTTIQV